MHHNFSISPDLSTANIIAEQMNDPDLKPIIQQLTGQPNNLLDNGKTFREFTMKSVVSENFPFLGDLWIYFCVVTT